MKRISHDLAGITQRIGRLGDEFDIAVQETKAYWKDDTGRAFMQRHATEIGPTINQLVSSLTVSIELFENIAKQLRDPDQY